MKIRRAAESDIGDCVRIHHETELHEDRTVTRKDMKDMVEDKRYGFLVAEEKTRPVGYIVFKHHGWNNCIYIEQLFVTKKYQGKGIGSALLKEAIKSGKKLDARILFLDVGEDRPDAIRFYLKNGFEKAGIIKDFYMGNRKDAIIFSCKIKR